MIHYNSKQTMRSLAYYLSKVFSLIHIIMMNHPSGRLRQTSFDCRTFARYIYYVAICFLSHGFVTDAQADDSTYTMQKLFANTSQSYFGFSVSIHNEYALIGDNNRAYVFKTTNTSYTWLHMSTLLPQNQYSSFGYSVSIYNEYALIGAPQADDDGPDSGVSYIFQMTNESWIQSAKLVPEYGHEGDKFGCSVSIYDRRALIGAPHNYYIVNGSGSAYIFTRNDGIWQQTDKLHSDDGAASDRFGWSVSIYDNYALIGAYKHVVSVSECGAAYMFEFETQSASWVQSAKLVAGDRNSGDAFGFRVSVYGQHALIGAPFKDSQRGTAYIFEKVLNGSWVQVGKLVANDGDFGDKFGHSVSIYAQYALIGSPNQRQITGAAYIFETHGGVWLQTAKLSAYDAIYDGYSGQAFGYSGSIYNEFALIGASSFGGAAYMFRNYASCESMWRETVNKYILANTNNSYLVGYRWTLCPFTFNSSASPTIEPTMDPTINPTMEPTTNPTINPTIDSTMNTTINPTISPTSNPTINPTFVADPTYVPTTESTKYPTFNATSPPTTYTAKELATHLISTTWAETVTVINPEVTHSKGTSGGIMITESRLQIVMAVLVFVGLISCCYAYYKKKHNGEIGERDGMELEISDNDNNGNNDNSAAEHSVVPPGIGHLSMSLLKYQSVDRDEDNRDEQNALEEKEGADDNEGVPNAYGVRRNGEENPDDLYDAPVATNIHYEEHQALVDWLQSKGLKHCVIHFVSNGYESLDYVKDITNVQDLIDIGIKSKADQDKLMRLIKFELNSNQPEKRDTVEMHIMQTPK
eukprot:601949_1